MNLLGTIDGDGGVNRYLYSAHVATHGHSYGIFGTFADRQGLALVVMMAYSSPSNVVNFGSTACNLGVFVSPCSHAVN